MKFSILFFAVLFFGLPNCFLSQHTIIPSPSNVNLTGGVLYMEKDITVNAQNLPGVIKEHLLRIWTKEIGKNIVFVKDQADIVFHESFNVHLDHYSLRIENNIDITYSSEASCFYALQTLIQLFDVEKSEIPKGFISDESRFMWRGMHLDVSRHFFSVATIKKYLDLMAFYKFNTFHWHLTDDQGWRIEILKYPKLTSIGAKRDSTIIGHASELNRGYEKKTTKDFYSQQEIKEVVEYASKRFITVVPEIELPGHASAALAAYPEFGCRNQQSKVQSEWGVFENIFCSKSSTITFLKDVLSEVTNLFPGEYIHIGGDEVPTVHWEQCSDCQFNMQKNNFSKAIELQRLFLNEIDAFLTLKGKKMIGWDEILDAGLSPNAVVMSWRGEKGGVEAAQQEHEVIMSPNSHCYFDHYQFIDEKEPLAIGGFLPLDKVFKFDPIPNGLLEYQKHYIKGAQANIWTEYITTENHLDYMVFPRLQALSEVLWSNKKSTYSEFLNKLTSYHLAFLQDKKVNVSKRFMATALEIFSKNGEVFLKSIPFESKCKIELYENNKLLSQSTGEIFQYTLPKSKRLEKHVYTVKTFLGDRQIDERSVSYSSHSLIGTSWNLSNAPSPNYAGKGAFTLSDGEFGTRPWNGKDWLGFQQERLNVKQDFLSLEYRDSLAISFLNAPSSWIYLPKEVIFTFELKRGKKLKVNVPVKGERVVAKCSKKYKSVEIEIQSNKLIPHGLQGSGHTPWLFIDEIWFKL